MNQQDIKSILKKWFKTKPHSCNLEIAGRHFAGKYAETLFDPISFLYENDILRINFDQYEVFTISKPEKVSILDQTDLVITKAEEIRIGWYYYGRDIKSENWCEDIYKIDGKKIQLFEIFDNKVTKKIIEFDDEYLIYIESRSSINH